jgi:hypothetical protein
MRATRVPALCAVLGFGLGFGATRLTTPAPRPPPRTAEEVGERIRETGFATPRLIHAETTPPGGAFLTYTERPREEILSLPWELGRKELAADWDRTVHVSKVGDRVPVPMGCVGAIVGDLFLCGDLRMSRGIQYRVLTGHGPPPDPRR